MLTVSIVTHHSPMLDMCLQSLNTATAGIPHETFVVDNNSTLFSPYELKHTHQNISLILNKKNVGFGRAHNQVMQQAKGEFILILNPDVILEKNTVRELLTYMIRHAHVAICAPKLLNNNGSLQFSCRQFPTLFVSLLRRLPISASQKKLRAYEMQDFDHDYARKVDWVSGACMLLRGKQFFDPRYFLYFEDVDLCRTAKEVHYVPSACATHGGGYASRGFSKAFIHHTASMIKYYWKWQGFSSSHSLTRKS